MKSLEHNNDNQYMYVRISFFTLGKTNLIYCSTGRW